VASTARPAAPVAALPSKAQLAAGAASVASLVTASPAFALVDNRLNGDGTGKIFGINDPAQGIAFFVVFATVFALFSNAAGSGDLGAGVEDGEDGGLGL